MSEVRFNLTIAAIAGGLVSFGVSSAKAELLSYYIGVDGLQTLTSGTYSGLANPNYNNLTFLYAHHYADTPSNNHYHSKGIEVYTGPVGSPSVIRSASDYVPEGTNPPIRLSEGSGMYSGKLVSNP